LLLKIIEERILVHRPPRAAIDRVERLADLPARLLVLGRHRSIRTLVIRPNGASGDDNGNSADSFQT